MTRFAFAAAAALFCSAMAFGQGPSVIIQNQEDSPFYYVVDPPDLAGLTAGSPLLASKVAGYFAAADTSTTFAMLAPQGDARLTDLTPGTHLLVGFFLVPGSDTSPVRVMSLQADTDVPDRFYAIFSGTAQLSVRRGVGKLTPYPVPAAGSEAAAASAAPSTDQPAGTPTAADTAAATGAAEASAAATAAAADAGPVPGLPTLASFDTSFNPGSFTRETQGDFKVLPIAQARSWTQLSTHVSRVQGSMDASGLKLAITVPAGFSPTVSYFLYVFPDRTADKENSLTLEIEPLARADRGACILWQKGADPQLVGSVTTTQTTVELDIPADQIASGPLAAAGPSPTVDLTAGSYDRARSTWEEFFYATLSAAAP